MYASIVNVCHFVRSPANFVGVDALGILGGCGVGTGIPPGGGGGGGGGGPPGGPGGVPPGGGGPPVGVCGEGGLLLLSVGDSDLLLLCPVGGVLDMDLPSIDSNPCARLAVPLTALWWIGSIRLPRIGLAKISVVPAGLPGGVSVDIVGLAGVLGILDRCPNRLVSV